MRRTGAAGRGTVVPGICGTASRSSEPSTMWPTSKAHRWRCVAARADRSGRRPGRASPPPSGPQRVDLALPGAAGPRLEAGADRHPRTTPCDRRRRSRPGGAKWRATASSAQRGGPYVAVLRYVQSCRAGNWARMVHQSGAEASALLLRWREGAATRAGEGGEVRPGRRGRGSNPDSGEPALPVRVARHPRVRLPRRKRCEASEIRADW